MMCNSCGGVIGRDCFNPSECAWIEEQQTNHARASDGRETTGGGWMMRCKEAGRERDEARAEVTALLNLVADIRAAVGDPTGTLMQDELVERCRHLVITRDEARRDRDEARKIAEDMFVVLDELGCGMKPLPWEDDK